MFESCVTVGFAANNGGQFPYYGCTIDQSQANDSQGKGTTGDESRRIDETNETKKELNEVEEYVDERVKEPL